VYLAGVVGAPWQDLAVDPNAATLEYRTNDVARTDGPVIDWTELLGSPEVGAPYDLYNAPPTDPLMWEQIEPRRGTDSDANGGEWNILERDDLQYACTFPLQAPVSCPALNGLDPSDTYCDCTYHGGPEYDNPTCNGLERTHAKAYPSIRPLQVLRDYGANSIVASICPRNTTEPNSSDYGYRPFVSALVGGMQRSLVDRCQERELSVSEQDGELAADCIIVEADPNEAACDSAHVRGQVDAAIAKKLRERLQQANMCQDADGDCLRFQLCEIAALTPGTADYQSCLESDNPSGDGWCYIDPDQGLGTRAQVERCPEHAQRKVRFAGRGSPRRGTATFLACEAGPQSED
jgi:hypothetical protein